MLCISKQTRIATHKQQRYTDLIILKVSDFKSVKFTPPNFIILSKVLLIEGTLRAQSTTKANNPVFYNMHTIHYPSIIYNCLCFAGSQELEMIPANIQWGVEYTLDRSPFYHKADT